MEDDDLVLGELVEMLAVEYRAGVGPRERQTLHDALGRGVERDPARRRASLVQSKPPTRTACKAPHPAHDARYMRRTVRIATMASLLGVVACGGRTTLPITGEQREPGGGFSDGGADGDDGPSPDASSDAGPASVPDCTGDLSMCLPPDAGVDWTGAAVIKCQPEQYLGSVTLILERLNGTTWHFVQKKFVYSASWGATFDDTTGPETVLTYRVCVLDANDSLRCGAPFTTQGPPNCGCEPTSCQLQTACNTKISDECGSMLDCGPCGYGKTCNENNTCCPPGFMSDDWGGCVCAPVDCNHGWWNTQDCSCYMGQ
jgi:hypothetical protein